MMFFRPSVRLSLVLDRGQTYVLKIQSTLEPRKLAQARDGRAKQQRGCSDHALWCLMLTGHSVSSVRERDAKQ